MIADTTFVSELVREMRAGARGPAREFLPRTGRKTYGFP